MNNRKPSDNELLKVLDNFTFENSLINSEEKKVEMIKPIKFDIKTCFPIGTFIESNFEVKFEYTKDNLRYAYRVCKNIYGQITGGHYKQIGKVWPSSGGPTFFGEDYEYEPAYLEVQGTIFLYEVRIGFTNSPILVLPCDTFEGINTGKVPFRKVNISEEDRKYQSKQSKTWPRDANGRFQ